MDIEQIKELISKDPIIKDMGLNITVKDESVLFIRGTVGEVRVTKLASGKCVADSRNMALRKKIKAILDEKINSDQPVQNAVEAAEKQAPASEPVAVKVDTPVQNEQQATKTTKSRGRPKKEKVPADQLPPDVGLESEKPADTETTDPKPGDKDFEPSNGEELAQHFEKTPEPKTETTNPPAEENPAEEEDNYAELPHVNKHRDAVDAILEAAGETNDVELIEDTEGFIQFRIADVDVVIEGDTVTCDNEMVKGKVETILVKKSGVRKEAPKQAPTPAPEPKKETPTPPIPQKPLTPASAKANQPVATSNSLYDRIMKTYSADLFEVFGDTGTLKSKGLVALALDAAKSGKSVYYLDTENNLMPPEVDELKSAGVIYKYTPVLSEINDIITKELPTKIYKLVIIDSVGMPVLRKYASMGVNQRGEALLDIIAWLGVLKEYTYKNKALAFISNQPQSEFGKSNPSEKGMNLSPFGDKSNFIPGHLLRSVKTLDGPNSSKGQWLAFRSRAHAKLEKVFEIEVTNEGSTIKMV
jgi:hypothetical protein